MLRAFSILVALTCVTACSSVAPNVDSGPVTDAGADLGTDIGGGSDAFDAPPLVDTPAPEDVPGVDAMRHLFTTEIGPITLAPGEEGTWCTLRRLGNVGPLGLRRITAHLGTSSHHLIFYRSVATTERLTPFPCQGFSGVQDINNFDSPLLIAQQAESTLAMPAGVGMRLNANQMIRIEFHGVNVTAAPATIRATVDLDSVDLNSSITPADILFWGNVNINLPARQVSEVHFFHPPWGSAYIFGLTSHTHHFGTLATISMATNTTGNSADSVDIRELHRSTSWSDAPLTVFDPPLRFSSGQGLHLRCRYNNTTDRVVRFGESVDDEMCFLWAYYYPGTRGTQACVEGSGFGDASVACFPP